MGIPQYINLSKKTGEEELDIKIINFWSWNQSDLLSNSLRGILAEYLVATALGIDEGIRAEWEPYDLISENGVKIEVKSSAYIQSWYQKSNSNISFKIRKTTGWDSKTNEYSNELKRQADVYVFCLLKHRDKETVNPLNLNQWEFYILPTKILNEKKGDQQSISLNPLLKLNPIITDYKGLKKVILDMAI